MPESPIEESFRKACSLAGIHFDQEEQVSRYRVDFIDRSRRLVIELDGHEFHKTKEQRTYDAKRDRQLHRDGFVVLRFTGSEVYTSLSRCIAEVKQTLSLINPQPTPAGAIYADWQFVERHSARCLNHYRSEYPQKNLQMISLSQLLDFLAPYLHLRGRFDVHLFGMASSFSTSFVDIDALKLCKSHEAYFNITEHQCEFIAWSLVEHLHKDGTAYDDLILIADDSAYPSLLDRGRTINAMIRRGGDETSMINIQTSKWQDIDYIIGYCLGLATHEL